MLNYTTIKEINLNLIISKNRIFRTSLKVGPSLRSYSAIIQRSKRLKIIKTSKNTATSPFKTRKDEASTSNTEKEQI